MAHLKRTGRLLVIEGPDGVGKTTLCRALAESLRAASHDLLEMSFPGKEPGTVGELVYRVHHDQEPVGIPAMAPLARQALHIAAHIDAIERQILPALADGVTVLLDRFWWSTWVYGIVSRCNRRSLRALIDAERAAWGSVRPALAVLVRRSIPIAREGPNEEWKQLVSEYDRLASREQEQYRVLRIDNEGSPSEATSAIVTALGAAARGRSTTKVTCDRLKAHPFPVPLVSHIHPIKPSIVYDTYWRFAAERQDVFFRRLEGAARPWTSDSILAEYKFTNAYRASDRVSQYLIRHVIYREDLPDSLHEIFFRIMLFKLFNKIGTWETLEAALGQLTHEEYRFEAYDRVLTRQLDRGETIYSAAYIMPSAGSRLGHERKHRNHLVLLERMLEQRVPQRLADCQKMQHAFELLKSFPSVGDFLAYQYVTDVNYSELTNFNESEFVVPGPGARDGIRKCFIDTGGLNEAELIKFMAERQSREFERLGLVFRSLWGRPLALIDCQNLFCEVDKYARVRHPEVAGLSGRSRIKQRLEPKPSLPTPWYPPKWGINEAIAAWSGALPARVPPSLYGGLTPM